MLDKVKLQSFLWLNAKIPSIAIVFHDWWRNPLACMSITL